MKVQDFLSEQGVKFEVIPHRPTYDAQHLAHEVHVSGHKVAKTVLLRLDGGKDYCVAVLPASKHVDFNRAQELLGAESVELASEKEIQEKCSDCQLGALPPFGSAYGMKTIVDASLQGDNTIIFEGNRHDEAVRMGFEDFSRIETPTVGQIAYG